MTDGVILKGKLDLLAKITVMVRMESGRIREILHNVIEYNGGYLGIGLLIEAIESAPTNQLVLAQMAEQVSLDYGKSGRK